MFYFVSILLIIPIYLVYTNIDNDIGDDLEYFLKEDFPSKIPTC